MTQDKIYAVIDFGSYEIRGMVASKMEKGRVSPIAYAVEKTGNAIRNGRIYNLDETTLKLSSILKQLNDGLPDNIEISQLYVGVGAMSMSSQSVSITHRMEKSEGEEISQEHLLSIESRLQDFRCDGYEVLTIPTPDYVVDGKQENHPKSILCKEITAHYRPIVVRSSLLRSLRTLIEDRLHLSVAGVLVNPIAEAEVTLSEDEKTLGVAYVNVGAGCTSVSIFKNNLLKLLRVIPLGGNNVSKDLCSLRLVYQEAEEIKKSYASVSTDIDPGEMVEVRSVDGFSERSISLLEMNRISQARMQEITANIMRIVTEFDTSSRLGAGMVVSGGALALDGYSRDIQKEFSFVRIGSVRSDKVDGNNAWAYQDSLRTCIGLVSLATEDCTRTITQDLTELVNSTQHKESQPKIAESTNLTSKRVSEEPEDLAQTSESIFPKEEIEKSKKRSLRNVFSPFGSMISDIVNKDLDD